MDPKRIRNVMSEVIGLWPRVEFLRGCKVRDLPLQCQKASAERIAVQGRIETDTEEHRTHKMNPSIQATA